MKEDQHTEWKPSWRDGQTGQAEARVRARVKTPVEKILTSRGMIDVPVALGEASAT